MKSRSTSPVHSSSKWPVVALLCGAGDGACGSSVASPAGSAAAVTTGELSACEAAQVAGAAPFFDLGGPQAVSWDWYQAPLDTAARCVNPSNYLYNEGFEWCARPITPLCKPSWRRLGEEACPGMNTGVASAASASLRSNQSQSTRQPRHACRGCALSHES
jgi:hypothetical protein